MPITRIIDRNNQGHPYQSQFLNLRGGLNDSKTDELINDNELSAVENFVPDIHKSGVLIKRDGLSVTSSQQSEALTSVFDGAASDYFTTSTTIRSLSGTSVDASLTSSTGPDWATFDDSSLGLIDIFVNGAQERRTANGTSWANVSNMLNFKHIEPYHGFLFGAGHDEGKLRWSAREDAETWSATNELIVTAEDDGITGLFHFEQYLMVMCKNSFHRVHGFSVDGMQITQSNKEVGCTSHRSIVGCRFGLFWWSNEGLIWSPDGAKAFNISLKKIPDVVRGLNRGQYGNVHGIYDPQQEAVMMWVHSAGSSTHDKIIYYYPGEAQEDGLGTFWIGTGDAAEMGASGVVLSSGVFNVYTGSAGAPGHLYEVTGTSDAGTTISAFYETKRESAESGEEAIKRAKQLTNLAIVEGATQITHSVYINDDASTTYSFDITHSPVGNFILDSSQLDIGTLGSGVTSTRGIVGFGAKWRKLKHRVEDSSGFQTRHRGVINKGTILSI